MDVTTGVRTVLADATTGSGRTLAEPYRVVHDPAGNRALVSILGPGAPDAVFAVDLATLERTAVRIKNETIEISSTAARSRSS